MSRKGKQSIFIGVPPADWGPSSFWSVPPSLDHVECYQKNLPMWQALGFVRSFNEAERNMPRGTRKWAIVSRHVKNRRGGEHPAARDRRRKQAESSISPEIAATIRETANRLFRRPPLLDSIKQPGNREFYLKLAALVVEGRLPEIAVHDAVHIMRQRQTPPANPAAYLRALIAKDLTTWRVSKTNTIIKLNDLLAEVALPAELTANVEIRPGISFDAAKVAQLLNACGVTADPVWWQSLLVEIIATGRRVGDVLADRSWCGNWRKFYADVNGIIRAAGLDPKTHSLHELRKFHAQQVQQAAKGGVAV